MSDIAVYGPPDDQACADDYDAYVAFASQHTSLRLAAAPSMESELWVLGPDGEWSAVTEQPMPASGKLSDRPCLTLYGGDIVGGMSGSPVLDGEGRAVGVVSTGGEPHHAPIIANTVSPWLLSRFAAVSRTARQVRP